MKRLGLGVVEEGRREGSTIASASVEIASVLANVGRSRVRGIPTKRGRMPVHHIFGKCVLEVDELVTYPQFCIVGLIGERLIRAVQVFFCKFREGDCSVVVITLSG